MRSGAANRARTDAAALLGAATGAADRRHRTLVLTPFSPFPSGSPNVDFCGYTMPHPSEPKFHLRLQTKGGARAVEVLQEGLDSLASMCDELEAVFSEAVPAVER